jgi:hypothetical protein
MPENNLPLLAKVFMGENKFSDEKYIDLGA